MAPSCPAKITDGETVTIVETSEELTLTSHPTLALVGRTFSVAESSHLLVFGNVIYIHGKISAPGKHIVIVAREVRTIAAGQEQAEINVDGAPPPAAPLPKPQAQPGGMGRSAGWYSEIFQQTHPIWAGIGDAGHDGDEGRPGEAGKSAGESYILCDILAKSSALTLSASGKRGRMVSRDKKVATGALAAQAIYISTMSGTTSMIIMSIYHQGREAVVGLGGRGGPGGPGGNSGNCLVIANKAIVGPTTPKGPISVVARPGALGHRGGRGENGPEGPRGADQPFTRVIHGRPNPRLRFLEPPFSGGYQGKEPLPDLPDPSPAKWGRYLLVHSVDAKSSPEILNPPYKDLCGIAQVSHLHMLLETARLRYLQWDAYRFAQDAQADDMKDELAALLDFLGLGLRLLPRFVAENDINVLDGIRNTVLSLTKQLAGTGLLWPDAGLCPARLAQHVF